MGEIRPAAHHRTCLRETSSSRRISWRSEPATGSMPGVRRARSLRKRSCARLLPYQPSCATPGLGPRNLSSPRARGEPSLASGRPRLEPVLGRLACCPRSTPTFQRDPISGTFAPRARSSRRGLSPDRNLPCPETPTSSSTGRPGPPSDTLWRSVSSFAAAYRCCPPSGSASNLLAACRRGNPLASRASGVDRLSQASIRSRTSMSIPLPLSPIENTRRQPRQRSHGQEPKVGESGSRARAHAEPTPARKRATSAIGSPALNPPSNHSTIIAPGVPRRTLLGMQVSVAHARGTLPSPA